MMMKIQTLMKKVVVAASMSAQALALVVPFSLVFQNTASADLSHDEHKTNKLWDKVQNNTIKHGSHDDLRKAHEQMARENSDPKVKAGNEATAKEHAAKAHKYQLKTEKYQKAYKTHLNSMDAGTRDKERARAEKANTIKRLTAPRRR
jgi:hypothetical protein